MSVTFCRCLVIGVLAATTTSLTHADEEWITDPAKLLAHLQARDAAFDNRSLTTDRIWSEKVSPAAHIAEAQWQARRFGGEPMPKPKEIPADFVQHHRLRQMLTLRGDEVTLERQGDLEPKPHPQYVAIDNVGHRWSNVGGIVRSYSPETKTLHLSGPTKPESMLLSYQKMMVWCSGFGFTRGMKSIESARVDGEMLVVKAKSQLLGYDTSDVELRLDQDYIVRQANIFTPVKIGTGGNKYVIKTRGTFDQHDAPPVAKHGSYQRILAPEGKPERVYTEYDFEFAMLSKKLTDTEYKERAEITPDEDARVLNFP